METRPMKDVLFGFQAAAADVAGDTVDSSSTAT